jgi:hypothetical protein
MQVTVDIQAARQQRKARRKKSSGIIHTLYSSTLDKRAQFVTCRLLVCVAPAMCYNPAGKIRATWAVRDKKGEKAQLYIPIA